MVHDPEHHFDELSAIGDVAAWLAAPAPSELA
jgi:hypothetical protein